MFATELAEIGKQYALLPGALTQIEDLLRKAATRSPRASLLGGPSLTLQGVARSTASDEITETTEGPGIDAVQAPPSARYEDLGLLGRGGMGEVRRVRDRDLNRTMAMKIIRAKLMRRPSVLARFVEEAQCGAQLQHPGILQVHELGTTPDGRAYFTMAEVQGRTLGDVIVEVHRANRGDRWVPAVSGWTFRRLVVAFRRVCDAVAYAHVKGVVHRDLKPENVMVGEHGEVLVVDWGLAKVRGQTDHAAAAGDLDVFGPDRVQTTRSQDDAYATRMGQVAGTPAYMPPEQAMGKIDQVDSRSDVYALGAILYEILSGRPPYEGSSGHEVLQKVLAGPPTRPGRSGGQGDTSTFSLFDHSSEFEAPSGPPLPEGQAEACDSDMAEAPLGPPLPEDLVEACNRAMARDRAHRFSDATSLAAEVTAWLDGARKRERGKAVVEDAEAMGPEASRLRANAARLRVESERMLESIPLWESEEEKAPGWAKADQAAALERQADALELQATQSLFGALTHAPDLLEAHAALAEHYRGQHATAEVAREAEISARDEALLRTHAAALPEGHETRQRCAAYLRGTGALTLVTDPPGAEVLLHRYEVNNRRLVPVFERSLGRTPLAKVAVEKGSYLCILKHPERVDTRYPVLIGRQGHWDGVPPGAPEPFPIRLPRPGELAPDDVLVPAGWFWSGGDPEAAASLPRRRLWCPDLVMKRFPVTNREYIAFLDDLVAQGREEEALEWVPRERAGKESEKGAVIYGRRSDGDRAAFRFELVPDSDGDLWELDWPVCMVDWWCAHAYTLWLEEKARRPWRLPGELEWEKAARGVDGRFFPWGDALDPSWCCMRDSHSGQSPLQVVDTFPVDESPFGVRGMGGNIRDWCAEPFDKAGPPLARATVAPPDLGDITSRARRAVRGGAWSYFARYSRAAFRNAVAPRYQDANGGFRVVRAR